MLALGTLSLLLSEEISLGAHVQLGAVVLNLLGKDLGGLLGRGELDKDGSLEVLGLGHATHADRLDGSFLGPEGLEGVKIHGGIETLSVDGAGINGSKSSLIEGVLATKLSAVLRHLDLLGVLQGLLDVLSGGSESLHALEPKNVSNLDV